MMEQKIMWEEKVYLRCMTVGVCVCVSDCDLMETNDDVALLLAVNLWALMNECVSHLIDLVCDIIPPHTHTHTKRRTWEEVCDSSLWVLALKVVSSTYGS